MSTPSLQWLALVSVFVMYQCQSASTEFKTDSHKNAKKASVLLILADDLGFDDLSLHGNPFIQSPHLDKLAKQSVQFSDFSVTPVCSTTRASLLTGRDFYKTGVSGVHGGRDYLHRSEILMSDLFKNAGYQTGMWGKWHIGKSEGYLPWDRGFDEAYYAELYDHQTSHGFFNGKKVEHKEWVSEVVTDYAIDFMQRSHASGQPFFAHVSYLSPHEPWLAPGEFVEPLLKQGLRPALANLYGMVNEMDFHIGRLMRFLTESGLAENTIVIFLSDNGPWFDSGNFGGMTQQEWQQRNPSQLAGNKGQSWQNGIKSPLFVRWQGTWQADTVERYVDVKDLYPTLAEALNLPYPDGQKPLDGASFVKYLKGDASGENPRYTYIASHDVISNKALFNQWTPVDDKARAGMVFRQQLIGIRNESHKLLLNPAMDRARYPKPVESYSLFALQQDPKEQQNIIHQFPKVAADLKTRLKAKFYQLVQSQDSFLPPVYLVGHSKVSVINGFGAAQTGGNTRNKAHHMTGMKVKGDFARYQISVQEDAKYDVYLTQDSHASAGLKISLSSTSHELVYEFKEAPVQLLGSLTLTAKDQWLELQVVANNSMKSWAEISHLRRLYLVPKGFPFKPDNWPLPY